MDLILLLRFCALLGFLPELRPWLKLKLINLRNFELRLELKRETLSLNSNVTELSSMRSHLWLSPSDRISTWTKKWNPCATSEEPIRNLWGTCEEPMMEPMRNLWGTYSGTYEEPMRNLWGTSEEPINLNIFPLKGRWENTNTQVYFLKIEEFCHRRV